MRTSYYLSRYKSSIADSKADDFSDIDEDLFDSQGSYNEKPEISKEKQVILKWLRTISESNPSLADGLEDSIVSWFIQSGHLLPKAIGIKTNEKIKDLTTAISVLAKSGCLSKQTMLYMKDFVETAPPVELVWKILNDVYQFALIKQKAKVPLTKAVGADTCILQRNKISGFLKALGLPKLPDVFSEPKEIVDDVFRNGNFLFSLYGKLTGESIQPLSTAVSAQRAVKNTQVAIALFVKRDFIDESFIKSASAIVSGNQFALQHLLSMILVNVSRSVGPLQTSTLGESTEVMHSTQSKRKDKETDDDSYDDEYEDNEEEESNDDVYVKNDKICDGTTLPKLITTLDPKFIKIPYILVDPKYEVEKKWNVRKTLEFLMKKNEWPKNISIDYEKLYNGEEKSLNQLFNGITSTYPDKFSNPASRESLKAALFI